MFEEIIFDQIQKKTYQIMSPFRQTSRVDLETAVLVFHGWESQACYLLLRNGPRAIFYGIASPYSDTYIPNDIEADESADNEVFCDLFTYRIEMDESELDNFVSNFDEHTLKKFNKSNKNKDEAIDDFLVRNAVWLLNPTVH